MEEAGDLCSCEDRGRGAATVSGVLPRRAVEACSRRTVACSRCTGTVPASPLPFAFPSMPTRLPHHTTSGGRASVTTSTARGGAHSSRPRGPGQPVPGWCTAPWPAWVAATLSGVELPFRAKVCGGVGALYRGYAFVEKTGTSKAHTFYHHRFTRRA